MQDAALMNSMIRSIANKNLKKTKKTWQVECIYTVFRYNCLLNAFYTITHMH